MRRDVLLLAAVLLLSTVDVSGWRRRRGGGCSAVNCQWSAWSCGACSASCGGGTKSCARTVAVGASCGGAGCSGSSTETRSCTGSNSCNHGSVATSGCSCNSGYTGSCCQSRKSCSSLRAPSHGSISGSSFLYGDRVSFSCNTGYVLHGSSSRTCQSNQVWSGTQPTCQRVSCPVLSQPAHGTMSGSHYYGDRVTFTCSAGYFLQGSTTRTCQSNQQWSGTQPTCERKSCPTLAAPTDGDMQGTSFLFGDVVTFSCHSGYELSGSQSRTCQSNQVWSGSQPTCNRKLCQQLSSPANGQVTGGHAYGDVASFTCSSGYELSGGDATRTCQADQQWSGTQPTCERKACVTLDSPPNGAVYGGHLYGDTATFSCDVGYELNGPSTITCQDIQTWTAASPTCDIKYCKPVSAPTNGQVSGDNLYGDTVTFTCDTGYELQGVTTITCLANQTWSHSSPVCQMVTCPELSPLANGQMTGGNLYGDIVTFVCNPGYELSGSQQRTCGANKQWSGSTAVCNRVSCPMLSTLLHGTISGGTLYGDLLTFDCDTGYELYGNSNVTCQANQTWSGTAPLCREIRCPPLTPPLNGQMTGGNAYGNTVVIVCDAGYQLVGNMTRTCQEDKEWSGTQPECHKVSCSQPVTPTNGSVTGGTFFGDYATFTCDPGHQLAGSNIMLCQANQQWSGTQPTCHRVQCATLPPLVDGHMTGGSLYGDTVKFSCHLGFQLVGSSERNCQADQQWSGTQPTCQRKECPPVTAPDHGSVTGSNLFGDTLVILCDPGYELDGTGSRTCQADQTWSGVEPTCKAITCADLDPPMNGDVIGGNSYGDTVTFSCSVGFELTGSVTLTCQHDKQWSGPVPSCKRKECSLQPSLDNVQVTGGHLFEDVVTFSCLSGFILNGNGTSVCQADQTWSGDPPSCDRVQCPALSAPTDGSFSGGFLYEDVVTFTCNEGYELSGTQTMTCQADMTWTSTEPNCQRKPCPVLDGIVDGTVTGGHLYGDTDTFTCSAGFQLVGDQDRTCQADQTWSGVQPSCQKICCTSPLVENSLSVGDTCVNDTITVTCDDGYTLVGNTTLTCTEDGVWDKQIPKCEAICCDSNLAISNGRVQLANGKFCYGSIAVFHCDTGYSLVGSGTATCREDGTWSDVPSCERVCCGEVGYIHSAQITTNGTCYNDVATLTCDPGFQLVSHSPIVCSAGGKWDGNSFCESNPICVRDHLASPANGHKICYTVHSVGEDRELCTMNCNPPKVYGVDVDTYECGDYTNWLWMTRQNNRLWFTAVSQCQDSQDPFSFVVIGGLTITSTTVTPPQLAAIRRFIRDELLRQRLCTWPCRISHISIDEGTRVRTTTGTSPIYIIDVTIQLYVEHSSHLSLQSNLLPTDTDAFLRQVAVDVKNFLTSGALIIPINGTNLTIEDTGVSISDPTVGCPVGFRPSGSYCVACPPGSMHIPMSGECAPCPIGTYQNTSAQADCVLCPGGTTTLSEGTSDFSECKDYADCNCGHHPCMLTTYGWACQCPTGYVNEDDKCVVLGACPEGSKVLGDVCYLVSNTTATYREAGDVCRRMGGQLVVVKDKETQDFIAANSDGKDLWIGLDDQLDEGEFKWTDGAALGSFSYWAPGEPNDASTYSSQDCVHLWPLAGFRWDDQPCGRMGHFVCQFIVQSGH